MGSALDNLDRAARLGLLRVHAESRLTAQALRDRMVREYIRRPDALAQAVNAAHASVPMLVGFVDACAEYLRSRKLV